MALNTIQTISLPASNKGWLGWEAPLVWIEKQWPEESSNFPESTMELTGTHFTFKILVFLVALFNCALLTKGFGSAHTQKQGKSRSH